MSPDNPLVLRYPSTMLKSWSMHTMQQGGKAGSIHSTNRCFLGTGALIGRGELPFCHVSFGLGFEYNINHVGQKHLL